MSDGICDDRSSPMKSHPPESSALEIDDNVDGTENNKSFEEESSSEIDLPDSPANTIPKDDSQEEITDDEDPPQQPKDVSKSEKALNNSNTSITYRNKKSPLGVESRRALHQKKKNDENSIQDSIYLKDKINELIEKVWCNKKIEKLKDWCNKNQLILMALGILMCFAAWLFIPSVNDSSLMSEHSNRIDDILVQYPRQDKRDLKYMFHVINNLNQEKYETDKVAVFTILYNDKKTAECLAEATANHAVKVINPHGDFERLNGSLINKDFSLSDKNFKKNIENKRVLVVYDFHNFPDEKVRHFHAICDKHTPFIKDEAVYIILLEMSQKQHEFPKKHEKVHSRMDELWFSLKSEILTPLKARLTDIVMVVQQEPNVWC